MQAVIKIERPRTFIENVWTCGPVRQLQAFEVVRELTDSTQAHLLQQFLAYFERRLGSDRFDLIDQLAGGGVALAIRFEQRMPGIVLVVQGTNGSTMRRFVQLGMELLEDELTRQEAKERPRKSKYRNLETIGLGKDLFAAQVGAALVLSNVEKELQLALDLYLDGPEKGLAARPGFLDVRNAIGSGSLSWGWLDLEAVRKAPGAAEIFAAKRNDANLTVLFGGLLDVARRSPFLCAGLYPCDHGFLVSFRMPRGRDGMPQELSAHVPLSCQSGSKPLLKPKNVIFSTSFYLDLAKFFTERGKLFNAEQVKAIDEFDKKSATVLAGTPFSKLVGMAGPYQRIVVVHQDQSIYKTVPSVRLPAFALVTQMREPERFGKRMEVVLRSAAIFAGLLAPLKLAEEQYGATHIVGYRFSEDRKSRDPMKDFLFNFSPCFARVGDQFVASSTVELCRELIDVLRQQKEAKATGGSAVVCSEMYASAVAALLEARKDRLFTQIILDQAMPPDQASREIASLLEWVRGLGSLRAESRYGRNDFRYDITFETSRVGATHRPANHLP